MDRVRTLHHEANIVVSQGPHQRAQSHHITIQSHLQLINHIKARSCQAHNHLRTDMLLTSLPMGGLVTMLAQHNMHEAWRRSYTDNNKLREIRRIVCTWFASNVHRSFQVPSWAHPVSKHYTKLTVPTIGELHSNNIEQQ